MNGTTGLREHVPLAAFTTLGVGGPARYFIELYSESDLAPALAFAERKRLPVFILGGGSNILVSDEGFRGLVIHVALRGVSSQPAGNHTIITAAAGENWDAIVAAAVSDGLSGIECLSGIPGSVGGTPVQNVGAYGQEVSQSITRVRAFDREENRGVELQASECAFSYRSSIFNTSLQNRFIILSVDFRLHCDGEPAIVYPDLQRMFESRESDATLADVRKAVLNIRAAKGMLIDGSDDDSRSAGSFFRNPVVERTFFERIASEFSESVPGFTLDDGKVKIPAAWLIEKAGFRRGDTRGRAAISRKHSLALVNLGGATAHEIVSLASQIVERVRQRFGIALTPEPVMIGFDRQYPV